jgi:plastocyanin
MRQPSALLLVAGLLATFGVAYVAACKLDADPPRPRVEAAQAASKPVEAPATPAPTKPRKPGAYEVMEVANGGTIRVTCKLARALPTPQIPLNKDQPGCGHGDMQNDRLVFDQATLGLANCVVHLVDIAKGKDWEGDLAKKAAIVVLDQKGCRYEPHVQIVRQGSKIEVKNSDPVQHNVKAFLNTKATLKFNLFSSSNQTLPPTEETTLDKPGMLLLACDIHYWMTGFIRIVPHPYHAVSGGDGTCELTHVPAGQYRIGCWHEGPFVQLVMNGAAVDNYKFSDDVVPPDQVVEVKAGETVDVTFVLDPK